MKIGRLHLLSLRDSRVYIPLGLRKTLKWTKEQPIILEEFSGMLIIKKFPEEMTKKIIQGEKK